MHTSLSPLLVFLLITAWLFVEYISGPVVALAKEVTKELVEVTKEAAKELLKWPEVVRGIRFKHGLTQEQLAEIVGVNVRTVQRWEAGIQEPHLSTRGLFYRAIGGIPGAFDDDGPEIVHVLLVAAPQTE